MDLLYAFKGRKMMRLTMEGGAEYTFTPEAFEASEVDDYLLFVRKDKGGGSGKADGYAFNVNHIMLLEFWEGDK